MQYRIHSIYEDKNIKVYQRLWNESGMKKYFIYDVKRDESTDKEFKSITQVKAFIKILKEQSNG